MSVHSLQSDDNKFISLAQVALYENPNAIGDDVHLLYSMSKDLTLSGVRVGMCYSENISLMNGIGTLFGLNSVS